MYVVPLLIATVISKRIHTVKCFAFCHVVNFYVVVQYVFAKGKMIFKAFCLKKQTEL